MVTLLFISRHSPENCPMYNEEYKKLFASMNVEEREKIMHKHGIKDVGSWMVPSEHLSVHVVEAPSAEAYHQFVAEFNPPYLRFSTTEMKIAISAKEAMKMMMETK